MEIEDANAIQDGTKDSQLALKSSFAIMPEDNDKLQKIYLQTQRRWMQIDIANYLQIKWHFYLLSIRMFRRNEEADKFGSK